LIILIAEVYILYLDIQKGILDLKKLCYFKNLSNGDSVPQINIIH